MSKKCPESVPRSVRHTFLTLQRHSRDTPEPGARRPRAHLMGHSLGHPCFGDPQDTRARRAQETQKLGGAPYSSTFVLRVFELLQEGEVNLRRWWRILTPFCQRLAQRTESWKSKLHIDCGKFSTGSQPFKMLLIARFHVTTQPSITPQRHDRRRIHCTFISIASSYLLRVMGYLHLTLFT